MKLQLLIPAKSRQNKMKIFESQNANDTWSVQAIYYCLCNLCVPLCFKLFSKSYRAQSFGYQVQKREHNHYGTGGKLTFFFLLVQALLPLSFAIFNKELKLRILVVMYFCAHELPVQRWAMHVLWDICSHVLWQIWVHLRLNRLLKRDYEVSLRQSFSILKSYNYILLLHREGELQSLIL